MFVKNKPIQKQAGFTIIELLIATTVFSVILLVVAAGIVKIGQNYYKNITQNRTQETVRTISEDISQSFQLANGTLRNGGPNQQCIGDARYTFNLNQRVTNPGTRGLIVERISPSTPCAGPIGANAIEMLSTNMRLLRFRVTPGTAEPDRTLQVDIRVAYGDDDLLTHYDDNGNPVSGDVVGDADAANCKGSANGGSFCATAQLDILVKRRLNIL